MLPVLDGALLILSAVEGVQAHTRTLWKALQEYHIPTLLYVNKMDRAGADFIRVAEDARRLLHPHMVPLQTFGDPHENTEGAPSYLWDQGPEHPEYGSMVEVLGGDG